MDITFLRNLAEVNRILTLASSGGSANMSKEDKDKFKYLHFNRNYYNTDATAVTSLRQQYHSRFYIDNNGKTWTVLPTAMNKFHMPADQYGLGSVTGFSKPWSRKFVRWDNQPWGGEFELIVKGDGQVIEGDNEAYGKMLGTYNFGKTALALKHKKLDIDPHFEFENSGSYVIYPQVQGMIEVTESKTLSEIIF